ncbi:hypothetical protein DFS33DRAFT_374419 [Desarmillaria ectypa]|nr:hypothetical protein DFS33DRAFT_374419 [Desarmillaria ectypa]
MQDLPVDLASLVGLWCTSVLYGIHLVLYLSCVSLLARRRWILLGSATIQFVVSTVHIAAGLRSLIEAFIWLKDPNGSTEYWNNQTRFVNVLQESATITNCIVGDVVLLWRLYVIWDKSLIVSLFPALMVLAFGVCGYITIYHLSSLIAFNPESVHALFRWLQASWSLSLATQICVTALIVARIWWMTRRTGSWQLSQKSQPYMDVIWMIVESGAISAFTSTLFLVFFNLKPQISIILGDSLGQISAIAPALIIFRVGLGLGAKVKTESLDSSYELHTRTALHVTVEHSVFSDQSYSKPENQSAENTSWQYRA